MKLGFIILAHNQPEAIRRLTDILATEGNQVLVHFDSGASKADKQAVQRIAADNPDRIQVISKVHCVWGEWSLVEAVLLSLREFERMPEPPDYIQLMSGADFPVRPISQFKEFLKSNPGRDYIECCDITRKPWVKGGLGKERLKFYFPFNFRTHRKSFDRVVRWHRKLRIRRRMPLDLTPHMGSQWWTLRWSTCAKLLEFIGKHPKVPKFFRSTWIPDESFFQTVIAKIVPKQEIADLQLTFHHLTPTGRPYVFYNDHLPLVHELPHFFVRKVSPEAAELHGNLRLPSCSGRGIPDEGQLRDSCNRERARIDGNHLFEGRVPGHCEPDDENRTMPGQDPMVLFLVADEEPLAELENLTRANPAYQWMGRPFAPERIAMPEDVLERIGMTEQSWQLRDRFVHEFIQHLISGSADSGIPAAALVIGGDPSHLETLGSLEGLLPVVVSDSPLKPHHRSRLAGMLHAASPAVFARVIYAQASGIPCLLADFSDEQPGRLRM